MKMNLKISLISVVAMTCVIWWHCSCGSAVEQWFIPATCVWAVPWFFFVSGVFFMSSVTAKNPARFVLGKVRSLLVPYVIWSCIGWGIYRIAGMPGVGESVLAFTPSTIYPMGNRALWYVRTLIFFNLAGVLAHAALGRMRIHTPWLLAAGILAADCLSRILGCALGPMSSGVYFALGIVMSKIARTQSAGGLGRWKNVSIVIACFLIALSTRVSWFMIGHSYSAPGDTLLANVSTVFVILSLWFALDCVPKKFLDNKFVRAVTPFTAFVYFMHYPLNAVAVRDIPIANRNMLFLLLVAALPMCYLVVAWSVKKWVGPIYGVLSGGR